MSLSGDKRANIIKAFNSTSRYLDGILNINNIYVDNMVKVCKGANIVYNDNVSTNIYDKCDDF